MLSSELELNITRIYKNKQKHFNASYEAIHKNNRQFSSFEIVKTFNI